MSRSGELEIVKDNLEIIKGVSGIRFWGLVFHRSIEPDSNIILLINCAGRFCIVFFRSGFSF